MESRKRPAPSLLPAFELSSPPGFPRPFKKQSRKAPPQHEYSYQRYPTPIPSSTTGILSSPPPQVLNRSPESYSQNSVSVRAPLSTVPSVTLPEDGEVLKLGRSSLSSNYQLSVNRLISRVHAEAQFIAATVPLEPNKIKIKCTGWNGLKIHCAARTWELKKGDTFTSETEFAEIILDVQNVRISIAWPNSEQTSPWPNLTSWDESPPCTLRYSAFSSHGDFIYSSPFCRNKRIKSPISPSPAGSHLPKDHITCALDNDEPAVIQIYEDESPVFNEFAPGYPNPCRQPTSSSVIASPTINPNSVESDYSDEENNPRVSSPNKPAGPDPLDLHKESSSPLTSTRSLNLTKKGSSSKTSSQILSHVTDQLAFSLKSSTPLSDLYENLPASFKRHDEDTPEGSVLNQDDLGVLLQSLKCIGEICREGKDAAGKSLESHYYYILEEDIEEERRNVVLNLRRPSLRNCRKQHKQYYWKKPKTP